MRVSILLVVCALCVVAQVPSEKSGAASDQTKVDPKLHADVVRLVELDGARERMRSGLKPLIENGKNVMMRTCNCDPAFGDEWAKRMLARTNLDDYVNVIVRAYEKYLSDDEILQLLTLIEKKNTQPASPSPHLKEKLAAIMPSLQSEIMGGSTQVGSKLGAEIGQEIGEEHPEYFKQPAQAK